MRNSRTLIAGRPGPTQHTALFPKPSAPKPKRHTPKSRKSKPWILNPTPLNPETPKPLKHAEERRPESYTWATCQRESRASSPLSGLGELRLSILAFKVLTVLFWGVRLPTSSSGLLMFCVGSWWGLHGLRGQGARDPHIRNSRSVPYFFF